MTALVPVTELFESHPVQIVRVSDSVTNECSTEAWFLAKDLSRPLGLTRQAIRNQVADLDPSDVRVSDTYTNKGSRKATFLSQSGVFQIAFLSRKPEARRFRKWCADLAVRYLRGEIAQTPSTDAAALYQQAAAIETLQRDVAELRLLVMAKLDGEKIVPKPPRALDGLDLWLETVACKAPGVWTLAQDLHRAFEGWRGSSLSCAQRAFTMGLSQRGYLTAQRGKYHVRYILGLKIGPSVLRLCKGVA